MPIKLITLFVALVTIAVSKPYDIPEAKVSISLPDKGWRITRENQPSGPLTIKAVFVADKGGATITVASVKGGPVTDDSLAEFVDGMKMFFGAGADVTEEKASFAGLRAVRLKGTATVMGVTREQEALAYLVGEVGWVVVCATPEGDRKALATVVSLVLEKK